VADGIVLGTFGKDTFHVAGNRGIVDIEQRHQDASVTVVNSYGARNQVLMNRMNMSRTLSELSFRSSRVNINPKAQLRRKPWLSNRREGAPQNQVYIGQLKKELHLMDYSVIS
jgi:hypothetical protein